MDLVLATKVGIIVFEVKDYSGWIFGNGYNVEWTQVLAYGKEKHRFYNPIKQNEGHILALRKTLRQFEHIPFYSVVVFYGNCTLKDISSIPTGTYIVKSSRVLDVLDVIMTSNPLANYTDKYEVLRVFQEAVKNGEDEDVRNQHINTVRNMHGKDRIFD